MHNKGERAVALRRGDDHMSPSVKNCLALKASHLPNYGKGGKIHFLVREKSKSIIDPHHPRPKG